MLTTHRRNASIADLSVHVRALTPAIADQSDRLTLAPFAARMRVDRTEGMRLTKSVYGARFTRPTTRTAATPGGLRAGSTSAEEPSTNSAIGDALND